jgi:hypothetical protein
MVLTYSGHVTIVNTIAPLLDLSDPRKILCAAEADTLERFIGPSQQFVLQDRVEERIA